jgi:hypothetical protein
MEQISKRMIHMSGIGNGSMVVDKHGIKIEAEKHHEVEHVLDINENAYIRSLSPRLYWYIKQIKEAW